MFFGGDEDPSYSTVVDWHHPCGVEKMDIEDRPRSGRPVVKTTLENIERVRSIIEEDPHCTYDDIEGETLLSRGTIHTIIHIST